MFSLFSHAWRSWNHARAVAVLAIAALAVGIGSTTAIYTVVQAVLLNPLPFANPDRYLHVLGTWRGIPGSMSSWSYPNCVDFAHRARTLESFGCVMTGDYNIVLRGVALHADGAGVSPAFMKTLGVPLIRGRWFTSEMGPHVAVISEALWRQTGSDPAIAGKTVDINNIPFVVAGIAPAWFHFPIDAHTQLWMPLNPSPEERASRGIKYMVAFAKMRPRVSLAAASADMSRIAAQLEREHVDEQNHTAAVKSLLGSAVEYVRPSLIILLVAAAALLLIACGNVASLFLARSVARQRDTAIRIAIGGSAARLGAQYLSEGLAIAFAGAVLGSLLSVLLVRTVLSMASDVLPRADQIGLDWRVLCVTLATAIVCGVLFSLAPLWQALRTSPNQVLTTGLRVSSNRASRRLLRLLVAAEIALSYLLLTVAGLFLGHMNILFRADPGFDPRDLITFSLFLSPQKFARGAERAAAHSRLLQAVRSVPGVQKAAFTSIIPFTDSQNDVFAVPDGMQLKGQNIVEVAKKYDYDIRYISDDFFATMRIAGRSGEYNMYPRDRAAHVQPTIIGQAVADKLWPGRNSIGHTLNLGDEDREFRVTGVVREVLDHFEEPSRGHIYVSNLSAWPGMFPTQFVVRSKLPISELIGPIRRAVAAVDPQTPVYMPQRMTDVVQSSLGRERLQSFVVSFFGAAALLLSLLGVYGVVSYSVRQRIPEIATRFALGATGNSLIGLVLREAMTTTFIGSVAGGLLVLAVVQLLTSLHVQLDDFRPYLTALALVAGATLLASVAPALTAGAVSPTVALGDGAENIGRRARRGYRRIARSVSSFIRRDDQSAAGMAMLAELADSTGQANSFNDAIHAALSTIVNKMNASGATLLVRRAPDQPFRCLSAVPENSQAWTLPQHTLLLNRLRHFYPGIPITKDDLQAFERWAQERDSGRLAEIATLSEIGPAAAVPVSVKDETVGILFVNPPHNTASFDPAQMRLLSSVAAQFALMLENSRLTDRIVEQERLKRDLALATEVQQRLFPERAPEIKTARLAGFCLPARGVGGDLYDFLRLDGYQIGVAIADVAGKGIAAALVTSIIQASIRSLAGTDGDSPAALAGKVNKLLCASTGPSSYATFFYAKFNETTRTLCYVNGGHNPPLLLRSGGRMEELAAGGMIIGMFPFCTYEETQVDLRPGDVLMAYTDGVSEAHNPAEDEFTDVRLKDLLRAYAHLPVDEMSSAIFDRLKAWMQDAPQHDDLTFVLMKVH